jgi:uncharacterized protein (TIGR02646 family)
MKCVAKGRPPEAFETWKALANDSWAPTYDDLQNPEKGILHEALLREQGWVCCYCGRGIARHDSHIEHFRPQETYPEQALAFENLFASCIREREPGAPLHCGHGKGNDFDEANHISPLEPGCERRFLYTLEGAIRPVDMGDDAAEYMGRLLKLDLAFLRNRRQEVLASVFDIDFLATASDDELRRLAAACREPDTEGRLTNFAHVVIRYIEQLLGQTV